MSSGIIMVDELRVSALFPRPLLYPVPAAVSGVSAPAHPPHANEGKGMSVAERLTMETKRNVQKVYALRKADSISGIGAEDELREKEEQAHRHLLSRLQAKHKQSEKEDIVNDNESLSRLTALKKEALRSESKVNSALVLEHQQQQVNIALRLAARGQTKKVKDKFKIARKKIVIVVGATKDK